MYQNQIDSLNAEIASLQGQIEKEKEEKNKLQSSFEEVYFISSIFISSPNPSYYVKLKVIRTQFPFSIKRLKIWISNIILVFLLSYSIIGNRHLWNHGYIQAFDFCYLPIRSSLQRLFWEQCSLSRQTAIDGSNWAIKRTTCFSTSTLLLLLISIYRKNMNPLFINWKNPRRMMLRCMLPNWMNTKSCFLKQLIKMYTRNCYAALIFFKYITIRLLSSH